MGMGQKIEFVAGTKYGKLTAIEDLGGGRKRRWLFQCECGETAVRAPSPVVSGNTKSCKKCAAIGRPQNTMGYSREYLRVNGITQNVMSVFRGYATHAQERNLEFSISPEEFLAISQMDCVYCGAPPSNISSHRKAEWVQEFKYSGLDRIDNSLGYVSGNIAPCCGYCNWCKKDKSVSEFLEWIGKVYAKNY